MLVFLSSVYTVLLCNHLLTVQAQSAENITSVLQDIIKVDPHARPVKNLTTTTNLTVSFTLLAIISFDTVQQTLISIGMLGLQWHNEYTTWSPRQYGNVFLLNLDSNKVWRPKIVIMNTMKDLKPVGDDNGIMRISYDGTSSWFPAERFETFCRVDVTYFPFDIQSCRWSVFAWGELPVEVDLHPETSTVTLDMLAANGEWEVMGSRAWRELDSTNSVVSVQYEVTLRRRPILLAMTILLPVFVLAVVNVYVFTIPSEAGERPSCAMTTLLSYGVFMSFILDSMPSSSETLPIMIVNISCQLVLSAVYVLLCILSLRLFHRDSSKHPVHKTVQRFIIWLEILVCLDPPAKNKIADPVPMQATENLTSSDCLESQKEAKMKISKLQDRLGKWAMARKKKYAAYSDPSDMTWCRVSRTLDKVFFRIFLCLVIVSNACVWTVMGIHYYN